MEKYEHQVLSKEQRKYIADHWQTQNDQRMAEEIGSSRNRVGRYRRRKGYVRTAKMMAAIRLGETESQYLQGTTVLTFHELREFWQLYRKGKKKWELCQHFNISDKHCLECLEVADMLWGRGPNKPVSNTATATTPTAEAEAELVKHTIPQPALVNGRPKAEYSNKSPYGVAQPGM